MLNVKHFSGIIGILVVAHLVHYFGIFYKTEEYQVKYSNCEYVQADFSLFGSEDSVFYSKDILIGIQANMHKIFQTNLPLEAVEKGGFYAVYGISTGKLVVKRVEVKNYPKEIFFIPHGIYLRNGNMLHVINHAFYSGGERVETYKITLNEQGHVVLEYLHFTQMAPKFNGISNDVVFLTADRYLITDWQVFPIPLRGLKDAPIWQKMVTFLVWAIKLKTTNVWDCKYIQGGDAICSKVPNSAGIMVNGITYDGKDTIAVTDTLERSTKFFKINNQTSEIEHFQTLFIDSMPDNVSYDFINKQFIVGGTNTAFEYLTLSSKLEQVQTNPTNKSIVDYQGKIHTIKFNPNTKLYESELLFSSSKAVVGLAGALIDESQKYIFINNFPDKALVVCTKNQ